MSETETPSTPTKTDLILKVGRLLEERRKSRGLSLEKITQSIKIKQSFIRAMETGNWKDLPGEVYARGFVARYAQFLGLDSKEIMAPYLEFRTSEDKTATPAQRTFSAPPFPKSGFVWIGVGIIFLIGLTKIIVSNQKASKGLTGGPVTTQAVVKISSVPVSAAPPVEVKKLDPHTLEVYSPFPLWLGIKTESRTFEGFLPEGATWTWKGEGNFSIRLGHTQQLALTFDGKLIPLAENQKRVSLPNEN